eukprot:6512760-Pyramimonas_sp.AAC.1
MCDRHAAPLEASPAAGRQAHFERGGAQRGRPRRLRQPRPPWSCGVRNARAVHLDRAHHPDGGARARHGADGLRESAHRRHAGQARAQGARLQ